VEPTLLSQIGATLYFLLYGASLYTAVLGKRLAWRLIPYVISALVVVPNTLRREEFVLPDALMIVFGGSLLTWLMIFCLRQEAKKLSGTDWDGRTD